MKNFIYIVCSWVIIFGVTYVQSSVLIAESATGGGSETAFGGLLIVTLGQETCTCSGNMHILLDYRTNSLLTLYKEDSGGSAMSDGYKKFTQLKKEFPIINSGIDSITSAISFISPIAHIAHASTFFTWYNPDYGRYQLGSYKSSSQPCIVEIYYCIPIPNMGTYGDSPGTGTTLY
jgi:hypothetical protein